MATPSKLAKDYRREAPEPNWASSGKSLQYEPIDLHIPPVPVAKEQYDKHLKARINPGSPGYLEWVDKFYDLKTQLEMAKGVRDNTWKTIYKSEEVIQAEQKPKGRGGYREGASKKLSLEERICIYNTHIEKMKQMEPLSPAWETERQGMYHQRRSMREAGYQIPANLAPVPRRAMQ